MRKEKAKKILEQVRKTYETIAEDFSHTRAHYGKEFELFAEYLKNGGTIADIGCGNGRFAGFLHENKQKIAPYHYIGMDQSKKLIEIAQQKHPHDTFVQGDLLNLPFDTESIDAALMIRSFHHIPSYELRLQTLLELQRVLKKKGILIISVWDLHQKKYFLPRLKAMLRCVFTLGSYEYNDTFIPWGTETKRYYHAFTLKELKYLIEKVGLTVIAAPQVEGVNDLIIIAYT